MAVLSITTWVLLSLSWSPFLAIIITWYSHGDTATTKSNKTIIQVVKPTVKPDYQISDCSTSVLVSTVFGYQQR